MSERRVLYIVEGDSAEKKLIRSMHRCLLGTRPDNIYVIRNNIHALLNSLKKVGDLRNIDILTFLRSSAAEDYRPLLDQNYTDKFLIFDMEPQDDSYDYGYLKEAMEHFSDSTVYGKLYINYPMIESCKHLKVPFDPEYKNRRVSIDDIRTKSYKGLVECESYKEIKHLASLERSSIMMMLEMNLRKSNWLLYGSFDIPGSAFEQTEMISILDIQNTCLEEERWIYVLNTCIMNVLDFTPTRILNELRGS